MNFRPHFLPFKVGFVNTKRMTKRKKMGRPKLPRAEARKIMLSTRVNEIEHEAIQKAIEAADEDKTVWLRNALLVMAANTVG